MSCVIPLLLAAALPQPLTDQPAGQIQRNRATAAAHMRIIEMTRIIFVEKEVPLRARRSRTGLIEFQ
jgi:hypothetical protein